MLVVVSVSLLLILLISCTFKESNSIINEPSKEGFYVIRKHGEHSVTIVAAKAENLSATGGSSEFYDLYTYSDVPDSLEIGQRVMIESDGPVMESFPYQAKAKQVKILPAYQPDQADLNEFQVVRMALETIEQSGEWPAISDVKYDLTNDRWIVSVKLGEEKSEMEIPDQPND